LTLFSFFQLAGLALFLAIVLQRAISLRLRRRINPIRLGLDHAGLRRLVAALLFLLVAVWALEVVFYAIGRPARIFPHPFTMIVIGGAPARLAGVALTLIGFALFIVAMLRLGTSWRLGIDESTPGALVTDGVYALSRNPIYIFFDLYFIGAFLLNGALVFLLFAGAAAILLHYQIVQEERFLSRQFGAAYAAYRARTARYVTLRPALERLAAYRRRLAAQ
jgi:protein-S-isoprenylcysteine O-methyltransferase Ste14